MRTWLVDEYIYDEDNGLESGAVLRYTDQEILEYYWDFWKNSMWEKYDEFDPIINEENCIQDWVANNWAWPEEEDKNE
jgi:hypothetical protein